MHYKDRYEAGRILAQDLERLRGDPDVIVLGIPRGGVVIAFEVARTLDAPLDVFITRKIGVPYNPELAIGAVASDGTVFVEHDLADHLGITSEYIEAETGRQREEIQRRLALYRGERRAPELKDKIIIVVDDGIATGATVRVALRALRHQSPRKLILAVPVGPPDTIAKLGHEADEVICPLTPSSFWAVSGFYEVFDQTRDDEVIRLLAQAAKARGEKGKVSE